jgi:hypothetical protein
MHRTLAHHGGVAIRKTAVFQFHRALQFRHPQDGFPVQAHEGFTEGTKALVHVPSPRDQTAVVGCDVGKGTETIVLQFIDEAGVVERFSALDWIGGAEGKRGQTNFSLSDHQCQRRVRTDKHGVQSSFRSTVSFRQACVTPGSPPC